jgi:hypothetical protein
MLNAMSSTENKEKLKDERISLSLVCCHAMSHVSIYMIIRSLSLILRHAVITHSLAIPLGIPLPAIVSQTPSQTPLLQVRVES